MVTTLTTYLRHAWFWIEWMLRSLYAASLYVCMSVENKTGVQDWIEILKLTANGRKDFIIRGSFFLLKIPLQSFTVNLVTNLPQFTVLPLLSCIYWMSSAADIPYFLGTNSFLLPFMYHFTKYWLLMYYTIRFKMYFRLFLRGCVKCQCTLVYLY